MQLSHEELQMVRSGQTLRLSEEGTEVVVVRADVFEQIRSSSYDSGDWTDEEMDLLAAEDADRLGWDGMEVYQDADQ